MERTYLITVCEKVGLEILMEARFATRAAPPLVKAQIEAFVVAKIVERLVDVQPTKNTDDFYFDYVEMNPLDIPTLP